jgi:hypothetical protein
MRVGPMASDDSAGNNGAFLLPNLKEPRKPVRVIASDGFGWEHVSVSLVNRVPSWREMCMVKRMFWDAEDVVVQFHPPESEYVNMHPHCLHLWRPVGVEIPRPPSILVGVPA